MRSSIADYEVIESVDRAGPGRTHYRCRPPARLGLATDVLVADLAVDDTNRAAVTDLISRMATVGDEHLLGFIEVGPDGGGARTYLCCEEPLPDPVPGDSRPSVAEALGQTLAAALGTHALHGAGVAHGAISPSRIARTSRGPVLVPGRLDQPPGAVVEVTSWRELVTVDPDVVGGGAPSRSSDIWSLAATLHLLLSDSALYPGLDGDQPVTAVQRVLFTRPEIDPAIPAPLRAIIAAGLEPDPADRPATALEMAEHLRAAADTEGAR